MSHFPSDTGYDFADKPTLQETARQRARWTAGVYYRRGKIEKTACMGCGGVAHEKHHFDYSKPLEVWWLCDQNGIDCHKRIHNDPLFAAQVRAKPHAPILSGKPHRVERKEIVVDTVYELWLIEQERELFRRALEQSGGNQSKVAETLGLNRATVRTKIRRCGLDPSTFNERRQALP